VVETAQQAGAQVAPLPGAVRREVQWPLEGGLELTTERCLHESSVWPALLGLGSAPHHLWLALGEGGATALGLTARTSSVAVRELHCHHARPTVCLGRRVLVQGGVL
jgi:hypothetical protein